MRETLSPIGSAARVALASLGARLLLLSGSGRPPPAEVESAAGCCCAPSGIWRAPAVSVARTQFALASQPVCFSKKTTTTASQLSGWVFANNYFSEVNGWWFWEVLAPLQIYDSRAFCLCERASASVVLARKFPFDTLSLCAASVQLSNGPRAC